MDDGTSNLESKNVCTSVGWFTFFFVKTTGFDSPNHFKEAQVLIKKRKKKIR
jgi:hypothetical protein